MRECCWLGSRVDIVGGCFDIGEGYHFLLAGLKGLILD